MNRLTAGLVCLLLVACTSEQAPGSGGEAAALEEQQPLEPLPNATIVSDRVACPLCEIEIELLADLAEGSDTALLGPTLHSLLPVNEGLLVATSKPGPPLLFANNGRLLRVLDVGSSNDNQSGLHTTLIRSGSGDSVIMLDAARQQITVLTQGLRPVRSFAVPAGVVDMAVIATGQLLLAIPGAAADSVAPLRRVSLADGSLLPSGAARVPVPRGADAAFGHRLVASSRDRRHFWSAHHIRYAIEKRTLDGEIVQVLERDTEWFKPSASIAPVSPDREPTARVVGIWEDPRGYLWVHTLTADGRWQRALRQGGNDSTGATRNRGQSSAAVVIEGRDIYWDTRIEVIDPETGALIATTVMDAELPVFGAGPRLGRVLTGPAGTLVGEVWSVRLLGWPGR